MQQITEALADHLDGEVTTLATCWKITRRDSEVLCFTDHDADLVIGGETYRAATGMTPSAVTSQAGLSIDNLELEGLIRDDGITEADLLAGRYDHAELNIFLVNYAAPAEGSLHLKTGWLGEVSLRDGMFVVEVRGISAALNQTIGEVYTPTCRAKLGDGRCKIDLEDYAHSGSITALDGVQAFYDSSREEADGYFAYGTITFTSGANEGLSMEIRDYANGRFGLFLPLPNPLQTGDAYDAVAGCDKRFDTCMARFSNALNFRGEPHVPGTDRILETAATRTR